jgi:hypothetical protein
MQYPESLGKIDNCCDFDICGSIKNRKQQKTVKNLFVAPQFVVNYLDFLKRVVVVTEWQHIFRRYRKYKIAFSRK